MSLFSFMGSKSAAAAPAKNTGGEVLIGELYDKAKGNLRLLFIYKKIEEAAEKGDWTLLNSLYHEFKITESSLN